MKKFNEWFNAPLTWKRYWLFCIVEFIISIGVVFSAILILAGYPQKAFEAIKTKIKGLFKKS